ncbi:sugar-binding protein [Ectobacillus ponti]|uniref:Sugar-binding protein n=1 Tax=Ectobacillus ponti TaxID=2961894 RepID=A0AA42BU03_9BACI|nr:sugar-binding protein [Ectobacillus ponti]MCP8970033.1 sugar-binding protein [Ectobacillus ponti]
MHKWKVVAYTLGVIVFLVSCTLSIFYGYQVMNHKAPSAKEEKKTYQYHVVLIPEELDNEYWRVVEEGAKAAAEKYGVLLEYTGPRQADLQEHLKAIQISAAARVDGILTQGLNDEQFTPLINRIVKTIPVITVDTDAAGSNRISYVGTDNYHAGYLAGQALLADTKGPVAVGIVTGNFYANHQLQRVQGFRDAIRGEERVRIVDLQQSGISRVKAAEIAYAMLQNHPDINAFYGTSALDGIGIAQVVEKYKKQKQPYIIGFDTLPETLAYINRGMIQATVVQEPYEMGYRSIEMMVDVLNGKTIPSVVHTDTRILRQKGLQ